MKISYNTDGYRSAEKPFEECCKFLSEQGVDSVEPQVIPGQATSILYGFDPTVSLESDPYELMEIVEGHGLELNCLSAHTNLMLEGEAGPSYIKKAIRFAKLIDVDMVNTSEGPKPDYMDEEQAFRAMETNLRYILRTAESFEIDVTMEPHNLYTVQPEYMRRILELVPSDRLGLNFDTGNVTLFGTDPLEMLGEFIDDIKRVHLKDLDEEILEEHRGETGIPAGCPLGKGVVPLREVIGRLKDVGFEGELVVECHYKDLKESLEFLREIL